MAGAPGHASEGAASPPRSTGSEHSERASLIPPGSMADALELEGVTRSFGGLVAVADVTLRVPERERRAIIGPNGAGKTTLFRLISGEKGVTPGGGKMF